MTVAFLRLAVVIPSYNAAAWIERAVTSVLSQEYPDTIVIVVDDGSSDGSAELVRARFGNRVQVETGPNRGACHARNRGLAIAREAGADHVLFLDADDYVEGEYLSAAAEAAASGADLLFGRIERRKGGVTTHIRSVDDSDLMPEQAFARWLEIPQINPAGIFFRVGFLDFIGGWNESVLINQDGEIVLRALLHRPMIKRVERGCGVYVIGHGSLSSQHTEAKLSNYVTTLKSLLHEADRVGFGAHTQAIEDTLYAVARMAFRQGWNDAGRQALSAFRARSPKRHVGGFAHRLAARVIGLERKVRFWKS